MNRCFSCITVHSIDGGKAKLSQQHYRLSKDDDGIEFRSDEDVRRISLPVRSDETRKSLFNRLNKDETWMINMHGSLEKADKKIMVSAEYDDVLD